MDIRFIDIEDNRLPSDADGIEELFENAVAASTTREFFVRLGNISGGSLVNVPVSLTGDHPDRVQVSFNEFGSYSDSLTLTSLAPNKSKNLFIKVTMPLSVNDESVTTLLWVGSDSLPIRYQAASALNVLTDPYPLYEGDFTEEVFRLFENKPVHRFMRFDPIANPDPANPSTAGRVKLKNFDLCSYLDPNDRDLGYEEPIAKDLVCIPSPKELDSIERWTAESATYEYADKSMIFLRPDFLNEMGGVPIWTLFHREASHAPTGSILDRSGGLERFKRTQFLIHRSGTTYSLEHLHPVFRGMAIGYFKATLRKLYEPLGTNLYGYSPFNHVYEEGSDRVIDRFACWSLPTSIGSTGGSSGGTGS